MTKDKDKMENILDKFGRNVFFFYICSNFSP